MEKRTLFFKKLSFGKINRFLYFRRKYLAFIIDVVIILYSLTMSVAIRFDFNVPGNYIDNYFKIASIFVAVKMFSICFFKLNSSLWRYISIVDLREVLKASIFSAMILFIIFYAWRQAISVNFAMTIVIIDFMIWFLAISAIRICVRMIREISDNAGDNPLIKTIVVGKLDDVDSFLHGMKNYKTGRKIIAAFGTRRRNGETLRGVKLQGSVTRIAKYAKQNKIKEIIFIPPYARKRFLNLVLSQLERISYSCSFKVVPSVVNITNGDINFSSIRKVNVEDLLGRPAVKFNSSEVASIVFNKNIMVTGGGGSIGSELCFQLCRYRPKKLVIFEFSEYNLYEIERKLKIEFPEQNIEAVLGDIRFKKTLLKAIETHSVELIYHAAAYKHVPLIEKNMLMGLHTNIIGTSYLADCAEKCGVKRVVIISTDKAVRPTSIMGASKRIAERIILERPSRETEFVVVRFGNVLGSRGSVIPLFEQQIQSGGPVTVTSKNMIRYFMSIPEAVELVLKAGTIATDRDIMILEMGEQVNIYEMAKRLIKLSGLMPHRDIKIEFTGIRPGEKEYEELLTKEEAVDRTSFDRICVARKKEKKYNNINLDEFISILNSGEEEEFRALCKKNISENML